MNLKNRERIYILLLAFVMGIAFYVARPLKERFKNRNFSGSQNRGPLGLDAFMELNQQVFPGTTNIKLALSDLEIDRLDAVKSIFFMGSQMPLGSSEWSVVDEFTQKGGKALFAIYDKESKHALYYSLKDKYLKDTSIAPVRDFTQGKTTKVIVRDPYEFIQPGEYQFYSPFKFDDKHCRKKPVACYLRRFSNGKGEVIVFLGVPPFANALFNKADNRRVAQDLLPITREALFDDYHFFLGKSNIFDLLMTYQISGPLFLMFCAMVLYLIFGGELVKKKEEFQPVKIESSHGFYLSYLKSFSKSPRFYESAFEKIRSLLPKSRYRSYFHGNESEEEIMDKLSKLGDMK